MQELKEMKMMLQIWMILRMNSKLRAQRKLKISTRYTYIYIHTLLNMYIYIYICSDHLRVELMFKQENGEQTQQWPPHRPAFSSIAGSGE